MTRERNNSSIGLAAMAMAGVTALGASSASSLAGIIIEPPPKGFATLCEQAGTDAKFDSNDWWASSEKGAIETWWDWRPVLFTFDAGEKPAATMLGLTLKNVSGTLPPAYEFVLALTINGVTEGKFTAAASEKDWQTTWIDLGERRGPMEVSILWLNDPWSPGTYDGNLSIGAVSLAQIPSPGVVSMACVGVLSLATRRPRRNV